MKKKGFTLIELLAVMIIIGILLTLTISAVSRYMNKGKKAYYIGLESTIKSSGQEYMDDYRSLLPREIGNTSVVTLDELVDNKYIDEVLDEDKNKCSGNVTVEKTGKQKYEYYVCLQCGSKYTSDTENCEKIGNNEENKNYMIELNGGATTVVNQCDELSLPTASVYQTINGEKTLINGNLLPSPKSVDTTILGETTVKWIYRYKNISKVVRVQDKVSPTKPVVQLATISGIDYNGKNSSGTANITNQNINMTVISKDYACIEKHPTLEGSGLDSIQYRVVGESTWNKVSTNKTTTKVTLNKTLYGKVELRTVDKYGNASEISNFEIYMDKEKPSKTIVTYLGGSNSHSYKNNYKLKLEATDDIGVSYYEIDWNNDGVADTTTGEVFVPWDGFDNCNTRFRAVDVAGNKGEWSDTNHIHMDTTAPTKVSVNLNGYTRGSWTNKNVTQTYTATDSLSGINYYEYSYNKTKIEGTTTSSWEIKTDGQYTVYARAVDKAGNRGQWCDVYSVKRDTVAPSCSLKVSNSPSKIREWYTSSVRIDFNTTTDSLSGIKTSSIDTPVINTNVSGKKITGTVVDNANNSNTCNISINTDISAPVISAKANPISLGTQDYAFTSNVNVIFGGLGGNTVCNPAASRKTGSYSVTCTASGNNGKSSNVSFSARHSYVATKRAADATAVYKSCENSACGSYYYSGYQCTCWCCGNYTGVGQCASDSYYTCGEDCRCGAGTKYYSCPTAACGIDHYNYSCGASETLVNQTCYSCPSGGSLSGETCVY